MNREILKYIYNNDLDKVDSIIGSGFDVGSVNANEKWNLLHLAFMSLASPPSVEMLDCLIKHGVEINAQDVYGNTPLHYAARTKDPALILFLLRSGANIDSVNNKGATPLRLLMSTKPYNLEAIEAFLSNGADVTNKNISGMSILDFVKEVAGKNNVNLIEVFEKYS